MSTSLDKRPRTAKSGGQSHGGGGRGAGLGLGRIEDRTLRSHVVRRLRKAILSGALAPGAPLVETELARELGVSRGPLREAIRELVEQGLITHVPYTGNYVSHITLKGLREIYSFRTVLERFAYGLIWERRGPAFAAALDAHHARLQQAIARGDGAGAIEAELELHSLPYDWSDHALLQESWKGLRGRLHFYFALHQRAHNRPGPARDAHDAYVRLAKGDDLAAMLAHIDRHMQQGLDTVIAFVSAMETAARDDNGGA